MNYKCYAKEEIRIFESLESNYIITFKNTIYLLKA